MKLKYNLIALSLAGGLFTACDPMEDIYNEIDAQGTVITKSEEEYVLSKADYATISKLAQKNATNKNDSNMAKRVASDMALNDFAKGETYIPEVLAGIYPSWGKGSTVGVTYNFKEDKSETLKKFFGVKLYNLSKEDYAKVWGKNGNEFLSPAHAPESVLPGVLKDAIKNAKEESFALVEYKYSDKEPQGKVLLKEDTEWRNDLYQFKEGAWAPYQGKEALAVAPEDYDAMGEPGKHDRFSSSVKADGYLPDFLKVKLPYAKEGDTQVVLYKFFKDKNKVTVVYADEYLYSGGVWALNANVSVHSKETYLHDGTKWLFDPTITVVMAEADYMILVNWVKNNKPEYLDKKYGNTEYWFGADSHHKNFSIDLGTRRSNDPEGKVSKDNNDEAAKYLMSMVQEGCRQMLSIKYPDAPTQMSGVDLYYKVQTLVYDGRDKQVYSFRYKSLGKGQFEVAGDPEVVK